MLRYTYIVCLVAFSFFSLNPPFYFHPQIIRKYYFITQEFISNSVHKNSVNSFCVYPCFFSMVIIIITVICVIVAIPEQETLSLRNLSFLESKHYSYEVFEPSMSITRTCTPVADTSRHIMTSVGRIVFYGYYCTRLYFR